MCTVAPDPTSSQARVPVRHVSYSYGSCLPPRESSGAPRVPQLWILPLYQEGSGAVTACPAVSYGPRASSIKKSLADLPVQLASHVPNARTHVSKVLDVKAIMGLQDVRAGSVINAY
jgi:hypothetical protein